MWILLHTSRNGGSYLWKSNCSSRSWYRSDRKRLGSFLSTSGFYIVINQQSMYTSVSHFHHDIQGGLVYKMHNLTHLHLTNVGWHDFSTPIFTKIHSLFPNLPTSIRISLHFKYTKISCGAKRGMKAKKIWFYHRCDKVWFEVAPLHCSCCDLWPDLILSGWKVKQACLSNTLCCHSMIFFVCTVVTKLLKLRLVLW